MWEDKNGPIKMLPNYDRKNRIICLIGYIIYGMGFMAIGIFHPENNIMGKVPMFIMASIAINGARSVIMKEFKKVIFHNKGIYVKYPLKKEKFFPWSYFHQVCVCYTSFTTRGERKARSVLCFVKPGEKKDMYGRWKAERLIYTGGVIALDYTDELYEEVKKYCPYEIPDLRGKGNYRL